MNGCVNRKPVGWLFGTAIFFPAQNLASPRQESKVSSKDRTIYSPSLGVPVSENHRSTEAFHLGWRLYSFWSRKPTMTPSSSFEGALAAQLPWQLMVYSSCFSPPQLPWLAYGQRNSWVLSLCFKTWMEGKYKATAEVETGATQHWKRCEPVLVVSHKVSGLRDVCFELS